MHVVTVATTITTTLTTTVTMTITGSRPARFFCRGFRVLDLAVRICVLGLLLSVVTPLRAAEKPTLTFAPLPLENASLTTARNIQLAALLSELLDQEVRVVLLPTYAAIIEGLVADDIDLAELGPLPALLARQRQPELEGIVSFREPNGNDGYRCAVVSAVDGVQGLQQLRSLIEEKPAETRTRPLMLTRAKSTCGPLTTLTLLEKAGISSAKLSPRYVGSHEAVALAVLRDPRAIGSVKDSVAQRHHALGLRVLKTSEPVPGFALVAHPGRFAKSRLMALQQALLNLDQARLARLDNGGHGFAAFDEQRYRQLEQLQARAAPLIDALETLLPKTQPEAPGNTAASGIR